MTSEKKYKFSIYYMLEAFSSQQQVVAVFLINKALFHKEFKGCFVSIIDFIKMNFNSHEIKDLLIAGFVISLAFAILLSGNILKITSYDYTLIVLFLIAFFTAGLGFLLHEIMHKYYAQKCGLRAEFRAFYPMLALALFFSFFGFILAAPGAVFITGRIDQKKNGKISLAGPMTNIVLAGIFLILTFVFFNSGILDHVFRYGLTINAYLAAFNMIPAMPFDGAKVLGWNKPIYFTTLGAAILLLITSFLV